MLLNMLAMFSLMPARSGWLYIHSPFSVKVGRCSDCAVRSQPRCARRARSRRRSLRGTSLTVVFGLVVCEASGCCLRGMGVATW